MKGNYPASVSIASLLEAGKLVKPKPKNKATLIFENFDLPTQKWIEVTQEDVVIDTERFSSGAFRDAFHAMSTRGTKHWVVKTYNANTITTIEDQARTTIENQCRKQVQLHAVSRHLAKTFQSKAPKEFGECFSFNKCFYTTYNGQPATIEEFVSGSFAKLINNDGECTGPQEDSSPYCKQLYAKVECLVHFTYHLTSKKLMLLDIQGANYNLYDPEIASSDLIDVDTQELYFCCGNCSTFGIQNFLKSHVCNDFCKLMDLSKEN